MWDAHPVPQKRTDCIEKIQEILNAGRTVEDWDEEAHSAKIWEIRELWKLERDEDKKILVGHRTELDRHEEHLRRMTTTMQETSEEVDDMRECLQQINAHECSLEDRQRKLEEKIDELEKKSIREKGEDAMVASGDVLPPSMFEIRAGELPKIKDFFTWERFVSIFPVITTGMSDISRKRYLLTELASACPGVIKEYGDQKTWTVEQLLERLRFYPSEVERAKLALGNIKAGKKESLESVYEKIEALIDQARPNWTCEEKFRESVRLFWRAVDRPFWKQELVRLNTEIRDKTSLFVAVRKLEKINRLEETNQKNVYVVSQIQDKVAEGAASFTRVPGASKNTRPSSMTCFKCGMQGHISRECRRLPSKTNFSEPRGSVKCSRCGYLGHTAASCRVRMYEKNRVGDERNKPTNDKGQAMLMGVQSEDQNRNLYSEIGGNDIRLDWREVLSRTENK